MMMMIVMVMTKKEAAFSVGLPHLPVTYIGCVSKKKKRE